MFLKVFYIFFAVVHISHARLGFQRPNTALDLDMFEEILDPELCDQQIEYLMNNPNLQFRFLDAGPRTPKGILLGNGVDLGSYHQCLGIKEDADNFDIQGKYCIIQSTLNQSLMLPDFKSSWLSVDEDFNMQTMKRGIHIGERSFQDGPPSLRFRLGVCVPKPCSVQRALDSTLSNLTAGLEVQVNSCRLPGDKPWVTADYVAVVLFSIIGLLTVLSTSYDLMYTFYQTKDLKETNTLYRTFSVYTNGRRLTTFSSNPDALHCLDGMRTIAMLWIVMGHTFVTENLLLNPVEAIQWTFSYKALWVTIAPYTVDSFFMLTGVLLFYTTHGKLSGETLLKNLHLFYVNRIVRLLPLLALAVLLQASLINRIFDGPYWLTVANHVQRCREHWWATLLFVQNFATPNTMCLTHSWYVSIDVHLHLISPLVLYWVLGKSRRNAWIALTASLMVLYVTTIIYNYYKGFVGGNLVPVGQVHDYEMNYYYNTFTRASPFFVGMIFGYILSTWKGQKPKIHVSLVLLLWLCTFTILGVLTYYVYAVMQPAWSNRTLDVILNSYGKSAWSVALGWIIFACVHGYSGPINWFLSLDMWKLPSRLSYAIFILHYPFQFTINSAELAPVYFTVGSFMFKFLSYVAFSYMIAFIACVLVDAPCSILFKMMMGDGKLQRPEGQNTNKTKENEIEELGRKNGEIVTEDLKTNKED